MKKERNRDGKICQIHFPGAENCKIPRVTNVASECEIQGKNRNGNGRRSRNSDYS